VLGIVGGVPLKPATAAGNAASAAPATDTSASAPAGAGASASLGASSDATSGATSADGPVSSPNGTTGGGDENKPESASSTARRPRPKNILWLDAATSAQDAMQKHAALMPSTVRIDGLQVN
jgi:hypothetical protein